MFIVNTGNPNGHFITSIQLQLISKGQSQWRPGVGERERENVRFLLVLGSAA